MYSVMMNAAAPMTGGMICPPVDAAASTAPANSGRYPVFFMSGMVMEPVETVFATELPLTVPCRALATTAAFAGPPTEPPQAPMAIPVIQSPTPLAFRKVAKIRNR